MAYCANCAAVLDPAQRFCSSCGQPSGTPAVVVSMPAPPITGDRRPSSVAIAIAILLLTSVFNLMSTANIFLTYRYRALATPVFLMRTVGLTILLILFIVGLWQRQGWARYMVLLFLVWGIGTLGYNVIRTGGNLAMFAFAIPIAVALLRVFAIYLLFRPESNAWFNRA
jgi:hypothetical protein